MQGYCSKGAGLVQTSIAWQCSGSAVARTSCPLLPQGSRIEAARATPLCLQYALRRTPLSSANGSAPLVATTELQLKKLRAQSRLTAVNCSYECIAVHGSNLGCTQVEIFWDNKMLLTFKNIFLPCAHTAQYNENHSPLNNLNIKMIT